MVVSKVTRENLEMALALTNLMFGDNVRFREFRCINAKHTRFRLTLRVMDSHGPGHRLGYHRKKDGDRRCIPSACWHVHGVFFDKILSLEPKARISTGLHGRRTITKDGGNWQDAQVGSMFDPAMLSDLCECENGYSLRGASVSRSLTSTRVRMVRQSDLTADCWLIQLFGVEQCDTCDVRGTPDCGGGETAKRLWAEHGRCQGCGFPLNNGEGTYCPQCRAD